MTPFPEVPTDAFLDELLTALASKPDCLLGERLGSLSGASRKSVRDVGGSLIDSYLSGSGDLPATWRELRSHELQTANGIWYEVREYVPDVVRFARSTPGLQATDFESSLEGRAKVLRAALKKTLGKPTTQQKQKVEFSWGADDPQAPGWGGVRVTTGRSELSLGGGDSAPWFSHWLRVELMGAPRS